MKLITKVHIDNFQHLRENNIKVKFLPLSVAVSLYGEDAHKDCGEYAYISVDVDEVSESILKILKLIPA